MRSAVDFLPSSITLLMTCWTSFERWMGSGSIGRTAAAARRGTYFAFTPYCERAFLRSLPDFRPGVASFFFGALRPLRTSCEVVGIRRGTVAARDPRPQAAAR